MDDPKLRLMVNSTRDANSSQSKPSLDLSYSSLTSVPPEISRHHFLRYLRLDNNFLETVPWKALMTIASLTDVNLSHNRITEVPRFVGEWKTILRLDLSSNLLSSIPKDLWPLFYSPKYVTILACRGTERYHPEISASLEAKYGKDVPADLEIEWKHPYGPGGFSYTEKYITRPKSWIYESTNVYRIILDNNVKLMASDSAWTDGRLHELVADWRYDLETRVEPLTEEGIKEGKKKQSRADEADEKQKTKYESTEAQRHRRREERLRSKGEGKERQSKHDGV